MNIANGDLMNKEVIMMIVWAIIAVAAYFVGFFIGRHEGIGKFLDGVMGISVKTNIETGAVDSITHYYSEEAYYEDCENAAEKEEIPSWLDSKQDNMQVSDQDNKQDKKVHKLKVKIKDKENNKDE